MSRALVPHMQQRVVRATSGVPMLEAHRLQASPWPTAPLDGVLVQASGAGQPACLSHTAPPLCLRLADAADQHGGQRSREAQHAPPLSASRRGAHRPDPGVLWERIRALPLFDAQQEDSLNDLRHGRRRRVLCPRRAALIAALAEALEVALHQRADQTRQVAALQRQITRLSAALTIWQAQARPSTPQARLLQQALEALTALQHTDLDSLVPTTQIDRALLLAWYEAFVQYGPSQRLYPRDAVYMALAVLWQRLAPAASPPPPLATLAARFGRWLRRYRSAAAPPRG